ncbi:uncharacterized protein BYT42DRAFT_132153 [Radiomyces spectabilis]|uniref:uncharacterized protein n=1 Tax=Radiomyces spectabilis TaxID=64574 RepID=UPI00221FE54E|nr:uncharacterized protein BYT42DRAFT_132153 [Radiomyces spectabilis]KAI8367591.1 hypothetical protein BYT42DRAFT_132153 [Radiomyces spectabilis]
MLKFLGPIRYFLGPPFTCVRTVTKWSRDTSKIKTTGVHANNSLHRWTADQEKQLYEILQHHQLPVTDPYTLPGSSAVPAKKGPFQHHTFKRRELTATPPRWTQPECDALMESVDKFGTKWSALAYYFGRPARSLTSRYYYAKEGKAQKHYWKWTKEADKRLMALVVEHGTDAWDLVGAELGRYKAHCKARYAALEKKDQSRLFSQAEEQAILEAAQIYGKKNFQAIKNITGVSASAKQINEYYRCHLDPAFDRSPWTLEEKLRLYKLYQELGNMKSVRKLMPKRSPYDLHKQYRLIRRLVELGRITINDDKDKQPFNQKHQQHSDDDHNHEQLDVNSMTKTSIIRLNR